MRKMICSPGSYVQGPGELKHLADYMKNMGKENAFLLVDAFIDSTYHKEIMSSFTEAGFPCKLSIFGGECSMEEINLNIEKMENSDIIFGIGGGKTLDTAKAVSYYQNCPVVIVPTAASSDAPCSRLSVIYHENGEFSHYLPLPKNPDVVIMDSDVITKAPSRFLSAGIGDALATYLEARACAESHAVTMTGGVATKSVLALAKLCYDTLLLQGYLAVCAVKENICNEAVEDIIEANIYLSGIGFESGGLAAAHAIHNGLTVLEETHKLLHGEKVAFGALTQLALENRPDEEILRIIKFCHLVDLPITLAELGLSDATDEYLKTAAVESCSPDDTMINMPFTVKPEDIVSAMRRIDNLGQASSI